MKSNQRPCVILSDYPIKTMAYQRFLSGLGEECVFALRTINADFSELAQAKLVVCDMNIMVDFEPSALSRLEQVFPNAHILFLEEDHSEMLMRFSNNRDVCRLGKLSEISVIHSTLREMLSRLNEKPKRVQRPRKDRVQA